MRKYIWVPILTVAITAAATFLSSETIVRPDVGSITFGFPLSWISVAHGFINAPPVWTVDPTSLIVDLAVWLLVSVGATYVWTRLRSERAQIPASYAGDEGIPQGNVASSSQEQRKVVRELSRRQVFLYLFGLAVAVCIYFIFTEGEELVTIIDEVLVAVVGVIGVFATAIRWRKGSFSQLKQLNNFMLILGVWMLVFSIFALEIEAGFPEDLADDIPKLFISLALIINRFV